MPRRKPDSGQEASPTARAAFSEPDRYITQAVSRARATVERSRQDLTAYTQLQPEKALLTALAAGYALRVLPTTRILSGLVHLILALLKPAALAYGAAKVWQKVQPSASSPSADTASEVGPPSSRNSGAVSNPSSQLK
jgi:hypothetical protein